MCTQNELQIILNHMVHVYQNIYQEDIYKIYLYGSYARGDYTAESDVDIVAIVRGDRKELQEKLKNVWDISADMELDYDVIISPTVLPYEEFEIYKDIIPYYRSIYMEGVELSA